jgi:hypothetical protein
MSCTLRRLLADSVSLSERPQRPQLLGRLPTQMADINSAGSLVLAAALGSSVLTAVVSKLVDRSSSHVEKVREGYAEATRALVAWGRFPYRIERRLDDEPSTLLELSARGAEIQERLAYAAGWVSSESPVLGILYADLAAVLRVGAGRHAREAWTSPPRTSAAMMNIQHDAESLRDQRPEWQIARLFGIALRYRFGWRRYLLPARVVRWRLAQMRIIERARDSFPDRSGSAV